MSTRFTSTVLRMHHCRLMTALAQALSSTRVVCANSLYLVGFVIAVSMLICCLAPQSYAADTLECPEIDPVQANLIREAMNAALIVDGNRADLANAINESIYKLQVSNLNISSTDMQDVLISAYCRIVVNTPGLTPSEKWSRMRHFESVLEQQIAINLVAPGTLIVADIPLPQGVFSELRSQAAASHQTTVQLMAAILTSAAGK